MYLGFVKEAHSEGYWPLFLSRVTLGEGPKFSFIMGPGQVLLAGLEGFICGFALLFLLHRLRRT